MALFRSAIGRRSAPPVGLRVALRFHLLRHSGTKLGHPFHPPGKRMKLYSKLLTSHNGVCRPCNSGGKYFVRFMSTMDHPEVSSKQEEISIASIEVQQPQRNKFKRPDKTARHIMNISDKEEVGKVQAEREIPDIIPGYIIQLKVILTQHLGDQSAGQEESEERMNPYKGSRHFHFPAIISISLQNSFLALFIVGFRHRFYGGFKFRCHTVRRFLLL